MALARVAKSSMRRSGGAFGTYRAQEVFCDGVSPYQCSLPSLESFRANNNSSYFSCIKMVNHMSFWSRGMKVTPHYEFRAAEAVAEESDVEYDEPRYPGLEATKHGEKPRVVVLGSGWGACRFLKGLDTKIYDVVCISPRNHMVFTPLLASTCVGTLEFRSVAEPVSQIQAALGKDPNCGFYLASCSGIDTDKHEVSDCL